MRPLGIQLQHLLPHHLISRCVLGLTRVRFRPVKNALTALFMRGFRPDMSDAVEPDAFAYDTFNAFFTRALRSDARPLARGAGVLASPVDGRISQLGRIDVDQLFARNERLVLLFEGDCGPFAVIFVGALNVGSMATVWHGDVTPRRPRRACRIPLPPAGERFLARGAEVGRFNMGSTVILLFAADRVALDAALAAGDAVQMGQALGRCNGTAT